MSRKNYANPAIALAVALPNLIHPSVALAANGVDKTKPKEIIIAQAKVKKAKKSRKITPANAKKQLMVELSRLSSARKREIGNARIGKLNSLSGNEIVRSGCFTHGFGCTGHPGITQGVICCAIIRTTI